ncbi:hypothetical protein SAMN05421747_10569 [Parapedobacter composti]|uniref:DUF5703 domain-containing protein n=2 Tax=Parapedobacter composti TaxID=623281 RepID=A0A1I1GTJ1_9SPHI|nr:hypothetical protein SAMN05421747_10569 [Parapedobacter composti]
MKQVPKIIAFILLFCLFFWADAQTPDLTPYHVIWETPSAHAGESMPLGGGDIGLNVWVEDGDILFYMSRSGAFDENNTLLKQGRVRVTMHPNPFSGKHFRQELKLDDGYVAITGAHEGLEATVTIWVDVFKPAIHVEAAANRNVSVTAVYESWRFVDHYPQPRENNGNSWKWAPPRPVVTRADSIAATDGAIVFYHRNRDSTAFDVVVAQQGLAQVKGSLFNPLARLTSGGVLFGDGFAYTGKTSGHYLATPYEGWMLQSRRPRRKHEMTAVLHIAQVPTVDAWKEGLDSLWRAAATGKPAAWARTRAWWNTFWARSYIVINPQDRPRGTVPWQVGRNYQLFRYMLACNAYGAYPTKFNGGLFTYDPVMVDSGAAFTPDFRNWGGGTHTAQNQRLVYWPMLKSGDLDMMKSQFEFYLRLRGNAELRSRVYWNHRGASFTEQMENFGLPNPAEYGWKRPADFDRGVEYNAWLEYQWDTVLEFCLMMLETHRYGGADIREYIPFIESCLRFFDEHYQYRARQRGRRTFDENGHLVIYPGSSAETYKMAYNAATTVAGLQVVSRRMLDLPPLLIGDSLRNYLDTLVNRIPPLSFREVGGKTMLSPAKLWERVNNTEAPQLYPVFPWGQYGIGLPGLDTARNTYWHDPDLLKFRSHIGWKQDNIFAARLGLTEEATKYTALKLQDSGRRFPAFWGPGFDWVPDHNWGGSGMIGLQEMLLQTVGNQIFVLPAWPADWDVHFKLHAPDSTTVEVMYVNGQITKLDVYPGERRKDVVICGPDSY